MALGHVYVVIKEQGHRAHGSKPRGYIGIHNKARWQLRYKNARA